MDMVGHEHVCMYMCFVSAAGPDEGIQIRSVVGIAEERGLTIVAALNDVKGNT